MMNLKDYYRKKNNFFTIRLTILIGFITGIFILNFFLEQKNSKIKFDELALTDSNNKFIEIENGKDVHCSDLSDLNKCLDSYKNTGEKKPVILWLGNSQLHVINEQQPGDEFSSSILHRKLYKLKKYALTFSQPNANLQEHYLLFAYLLNKFPVETLVLPVFFDDMREEVIRQNIKIILEKPQTMKIIKNSFTAKNLISIKNKKNFFHSQSDKEKKNFQNNFENFLNRKLADIWPVWNEREYLRRKFLSSLYFLRNTIFNIKPTTTRKMIKGNYLKNIKAYEDILNLAQISGVDVLVYIPPIRNDVKIPYLLSEYFNFKKEIQKIAYKYESNFTSLESIIPPESWGYKASTNLKKAKELDFMHFKDKGHKLIAEALYIEIKNVLKK